MEEQKKKSRLLPILLIMLIIAGGLLLILIFQDEEKPENNQIEDNNEEEDIDVKLLPDDGVKQEYVDELSEANNKFMFDMYSQISEEANIFFSPYSIYSALSMTYEGAKGETADEMKDVLYAPEDIDQLRLSSARMYNVINKEDKSYKLNTANYLWAQEDYQFLQEYFSTVENYYG